MLLITSLLLAVTFAEKNIVFEDNFGADQWTHISTTGLHERGFVHSRGEYGICDKKEIKRPENVIVSPLVRLERAVDQIELSFRVKLEDNSRSRVQVAVLPTESELDWSVGYQVARARFEGTRDSLKQLQSIKFNRVKFGVDTHSFYIAIFDNSSCETLKFVEAFYAYCPSTRDSLVSFPDSLLDHVTEGSCVENSEKAEGEKLNGFCDSVATWQFPVHEEYPCRCSPGFQPDNSGKSCLPCADNHYKTSVGNSNCSTCPANSYSLGAPSAAGCQCISGFYRSPDEDTLHDPCTRPPLRPRYGNVTTRYTTAVIQWERTLSRDGERNLMWFDIELCDDASSRYESCPVARVDGHQGRFFRYEWSDLQPDTSYTVTVCAKSAVAAQALRDNPAKYSSESCWQTSTKTTRPLKVSDMRVRALGRARVRLTWQPPQVYISNMNLLNYTVRAVCNDLGYTTISTPSLQYTFNDLPPCAYIFSVVAQYDGYLGAASNSSYTILEAPPGLHMIGPPDAGVMLMIGVVAIVLLILVAVFISAVCILRRKHGEWDQAMPHPNGGYYEYHHMKQPLSYTSGEVPIGQMFIDPSYYMYNLDEMMNEFTNQIDVNALTIANHAEIDDGSGFGHRGVYQPADQFPTYVAIKSCTLEECEKARELFCMQAVIMGQFSHPNVLQLYGVCFRTNPMLMLAELTTGGTLEQVVAEHGGKLSPPHLVQLVRGVACGMHYLSDLGYVHKVLCSQHILVSNGVCKISGFDQRLLLDEELTSSSSDVISAALTPWSAPEVLSMRKYSTASDVWSFGVLVWEVLSLMERPYWNWTNNEIIKSVEGGYRLPAPRGCPAVLYDLMQCTWAGDSSMRPDFACLQERLQAIVTQPELLLDTATAAPRTKLTASLSATLPRINSLSTAAGGSSCMASSVPVLDWLQSLKLEQYSEKFEMSGYYTLEDVLQSTVDSSKLADIGVCQKSHRKKILESIHRFNAETKPKNFVTLDASPSVFTLA